MADIKKRLWRWLALALLGYACIVAVMAALQTTLVFPAPSTPRTTLEEAAQRFGATEVEIQASDGTDLYGWRVGDHPTLVLYFSGNGSSVGAGGLYRLLDTQGLSTLHINYRGYPGSAGTPSEPGIRLDAQAAWAEARRT